MQCVGYDVEFQRNLAQKFPLFVPPERKERSGKKGTGKTRKGPQNSAKGTTRKAAGRARRVRVEESDGDEYDEDQRYVEQVVSRGTISRPRKTRVMSS